MDDYKKHLLDENKTIKDAFSKLNELAKDAILFIIDKNDVLIGSLTDGDIRRGILKGLNLESNILEFIQPNPKCFIKGEFSLSQMQEWKRNNYKVIPLIDSERIIIDIINFRIQKSYLPIDAIIMAGGVGSRLRPLTLNTPKPLLKVGGKPIVEYNVDRLNLFGIKNLTFSIKYLGNQIIDYFGNGSGRDMKIQYVSEDEPLGTIGALSLIDNFENDFVLVMNSDLLTNIDFERIFNDLVSKKGDLIVATIPYEVNIPYGVIELDGEDIIKLKEKPTYTYYSNAGIYIFKKEHLKYIPHNTKFNATDFMEVLMKDKKKVIHFPILDYWLDIGKPHDFEKAQRDILNIKF